MNKKLLVVSIIAAGAIILGYTLFQRFLQTHYGDPEGLLMAESRRTMAENQRKIENWPVYTNQKYNFQIKYPPNWLVTYQSDTPSMIVEIASVPKDKYVSQQLIPPPGEQWVTIEKQECPTEDSHGFQSSNTKPELLEQVWCLTGFRFTFSLYADDPNKDKAEETLNLVANSFGSYKIPINQ
jgi:hypothetical protein